MSTGAIVTEVGVPATAWHGRAPEVWRARWGVPLFRVYRRVGSTNDVARVLAEDGAPHGSVVIAEEQTRGRGRGGRTWAGVPGKSLLLSVVLRQPSAASANVLPLRLGLATAAAIEEVAPVTVALKWPNDLLLADRKVGGLLCERAVDAQGSAFVVAGIGINVGQNDDDFPPELADIATSVAAASGVEAAIPDLAERLISAIVQVGSTAALDATELAELEKRDALRGHVVAVDGRLGRAAGIAADGALLVQEEAGQVRRVLAGTVRRVDARGQA